MSTVPVPLDQPITIKVIVKSPEEKIILANVGTEVPQDESSAHSVLSTASDDPSEKEVALQIISDIQILSELAEPGDEAVVIRTVGELNKAYGISIESLEELAHEDLDGDNEAGEDPDHAAHVLGTEPEEVTIDDFESNISDPTLSFVDDEDDETQVLNPDGHIKEGYNPLDWSYEIEEDIMREEEVALEEEKVEVPEDSETLEEKNSPAQISQFFSNILGKVRSGSIVDNSVVVSVARACGVDTDGVLKALANLLSTIQTSNIVGLYKGANGFFLGPAVLTVDGLVKATAGQGATSMTSGINNQQAEQLIKSSQKLEPTMDNAKQVMSALAIGA